MTLFDPAEARPPPRPRSPQPPPPGFVRLKLTVAYDGRGFRGFAVQQGVKTVGGTLTTALARVLGHEVVLTCAGRTDAGVHAWGQVVSLDAQEDGLDPVHVQRAVNRQCAPAVVVRSVEVAVPDFDARRSARARRYRYTVLNREAPDPFLAWVSWHVPGPIDLAALRLSCDPLIGEHDFSSFCRVRRDQQASTVRFVHDARWTDLGDGVMRFEILASAFCHQMVRSLVGTMVDMGRGRRRAGEMAGLLRACDRAGASPLAPPHGLCLWDVLYEAPA